MVECFENDHKVNSKCFICNSIIVLLRDDLNTVYISQKIQREKFDVSQKPLIQKMHTEPEILNGGFGVSSGDLHLLKAPSIIKHQAMIKARSRQRHRLLVISGTAVQPYRYSSALHARGGRG